MAFLILPAFSHGNILTDGLAFCLSEGAKPCQINFAADITCIESFFFKFYGYIQAFQQPYVFDRIQRVSRKPAK